MFEKSQKEEKFQLGFRMESLAVRLSQAGRGYLLYRRLEVGVILLFARLLQKLTIDSETDR